MIEIYVALTLLGIGYIVNQKKIPLILEKQGGDADNVLSNAEISTINVKKIEFEKVREANVQGVRSFSRELK